MKRLGGQPVVEYCSPSPPTPKNSPSDARPRSRRSRGASTRTTAATSTAVRDRQGRQHPRRRARPRLPAPRRAAEGANRPEALHALRGEEVEGALGGGRARAEDDGTKSIAEFMSRLPTTRAHEDGHERAALLRRHHRRRWTPRRASPSRGRDHPYLSQRASSGRSSRRSAPSTAATRPIWQGHGARATTARLPKCDKDDDCGWSVRRAESPGSTGDRVEDDRHRG